MNGDSPTSLAARRFERVVGPWLPEMRRLATHLTGSAEQAEDLVQDLVVRLYPRLDQVARLERPRPWLARVLYRLFVDEWRRRRSGPALAPEAEVDDQPATGDVPDEAFERALTRNRLQAALDRLPEAQREAVILHDVEGYGLAEIGEITGVAEGTLKSRLHRARMRLRALLIEGTEGPGDT